MPRCRVVEPLVKILPISDGDTLTVKRQLNAGEARAAFERMAIAGVDGSLRLNRLQVGLTTILAYLVDWTLVDKAGNVIPIRDQPQDAVIAALNAIDSDSYAEIKDAIEAHDVAVREEREAAKNAQGTPSESVAT